MATVTIYRVTRGGQGMYHGGLWWDAVTAKFGDRHNVNTVERQPAPNNDPILNSVPYEQIQAMNYGFASKRQLRRWIYRKEWRQSLEREGGVVEVWKVDKADAVKGQHQATFRQDRATKLGTLSLTSF